MSKGFWKNVRDMLPFSVVEHGGAGVLSVFLLPRADGWGFSQLGNNPMGEGPGALKYQIIGTLHAATYMRGNDACNSALSMLVHMTWPCPA